jgi:hypothetical protein
MRGNQGLQVADQLRVAAEREPCLGVELGGAELELGEARDFAGRLAVVAGTREDRPAPLVERLSRCRGCIGDVARVEARACLDRGALEAERVDLLGLDVDQVAGRAGDEQAARQRAAEPGHMHLDRIRCPPGRGVAPQVCDERRGRDETSGPEQEQAEYRLLARRSEIQLLAAGHDGKRPQDPEAERYVDRDQASNLPCPRDELSDPAASARTSPSRCEPRQRD